MELIVDSFEVVTIHEVYRVTEKGEPLNRKQVLIYGHLSMNVFPFWMFCDAELPTHEYPLWPVFSHDHSASLIAPVSAKFISTASVTKNYGVMKPGPLGFKEAWWVTIDGLYKITLQASWTPFLIIPATDPYQLEINTEGRNDRDIYWKV